MFILYLALVVLLFGILFFVYSISTKVIQRSEFLDEKDLDYYETDSSSVLDVEDPYFMQDGVVNRESSGGETVETGNDSVSGELFVEEQRKAGSEYNVTIFEDRENSVRFGKGIPDDKGFSGLKRVGAGIFAISTNSFDLQVDSKYFRFDFHHIQKIEGYDNSILLYIDYLKFPFLIISEDYSFSNTVLKKYKGE